MKDDKFLVAIAYEKWRLNSRTMKLKKMSSQALLRGRNSHRMPVSKMGIEYEYQRIAKKYNFWFAWINIKYQMSQSKYDALIILIQFDQSIYLK